MTAELYLMMSWKVDAKDELVDTIENLNKAEINRIEIRLSRLWMTSYIFEWITKLRMLRMQVTMNMLKKHCVDMKEEAEETVLTREQSQENG